MEEEGTAGHGWRLAAAGTAMRVLASDAPFQTADSQSSIDR